MAAGEASIVRTHDSLDCRRILAEYDRFLAVVVAPRSLFRFAESLATTFEGDGRVVALSSGNQRGGGVMLRPFDLAARSLLIVGGLNWLSVAAGKFDFVAYLTGSRHGRPTIATRTVYGLVGGAALWSLSRLIEQEAFPKRAASQRQPVRSAMSADVTSVDRRTPVREAARLLAREDVGSLPILEGDRVVGIVTDRDIVLRAVAEGRDIENVTVGEIASQELVTVGADDELDEALRRMARHQVRRLPVLEGGRLVGMLAQRDIALTADDARAGAVVEEISR
jgi:CBS domain-containing protein